MMCSSIKFELNTKLPKVLTPSGNSTSSSSRQSEKAVAPTFSSVLGSLISFIVICAKADEGNSLQSASERSSRSTSDSESRRK